MTTEFNYDDYITFTEDLMEANPKWRYGQALFNSLAIGYPEIAEEVRGTDLDTFYKDKKDCKPLLDWLKERCS